MVGLVVTSLLSVAYFGMTGFEVWGWLCSSPSGTGGSCRDDVDRGRWRGLGRRWGGREARRRGSSTNRNPNQIQDETRIQNSKNVSESKLLKLDNATNSNAENSHDLSLKPIKRHKRKTSLSVVSNMDSTLIGIIICQSILFTYFITCNELYVRVNHTDGQDGSWGFGQVNLSI